VNRYAARVYPYRPLAARAARLLLEPDPLLANTEIIGAFDGTKVMAVAHLGVLAPAAGPRDYGIVRPGDGVVPWFFCATMRAGHALLRHCLDRLPAQVYAYPEFGGLNACFMFKTGTIPACFTEEEIVFKTNGFVLATSTAWGRQERFWMAWDMPGKLEKTSFPDTLRLERKTSSGLSSHVRLLDRGSSQLAGECRISGAETCRRPFPGHVHIDWLGVNEKYRNQSLGRKLLLEQCRWARAHGARTAVLSTHADQPAWHLYNRLGFRGVGLSRSFFLERK
jgi:ribosomal protein S18 acetylase RimI-like enzyme